jgi:hypothetical protein
MTSNLAENNRPGWTLKNDQVSITILEGGGHISQIGLAERPDLNPLWQPTWPPVEPWAYTPANAQTHESQLLGAICGHNLCLGWFGGPSPEEAAAGLGCHGEAPVARWQLIQQTEAEGTRTLVCGCDLPVAQMAFERTVTLRDGSCIINVRERIRNLSLRDQPYTMAEHVTFGPPFLEKGVTFFDMPATLGHTYPVDFSQQQRFWTDRGFRWPMVQSQAKQNTFIDLRTIPASCKSSSDFTTQLIHPSAERAWFSAVNPRIGIMVAYAWRRSEFPWVGNWEENYGRREAPWNGQTLARGMEFANTPFPMSLRQSVDMRTFHGLPTYRWLPARGEATFEFDIVQMTVDKKTCGVSSIAPRDGSYDIAFTV